MTSQGSRKTIETLYANRYLSLRRKDDYVYVHESRANGGLVAILVYDSSRPEAVLGRYEVCPAHDDPSPQLCSITGGVESGHTPAESAVQELREEAGYCADAVELEPLGVVRPTKSADTRVYLYAFDACGKERYGAYGDGTKHEQTAYCEWVSRKDAILCKDPLMATMIARREELAQEYRKHRIGN